MELAAESSLVEARRALDGVTKIHEILALDTLWTGALAGEIVPRDAPEVAEIGETMLAILEQLRAEAEFYHSILQRDPERFATAVDAVLAETERLRGAPFLGGLRKRYGERGWSGEIDDAFRILFESGPVEAELTEKISRIRSGEHAPGDLPKWWKCAAVLAAFGLAVGSLVLAPPASVAALLMTGSAECIGLAIALPGCRD